MVAPGAESARAISGCLARPRSDYSFLEIISWPFRPNYAFQNIKASGIQVWWAHEDSNLEPKDYESSALTIEL